MKPRAIERPSLRPVAGRPIAVAVLLLSVSTGRVQRHRSDDVHRASGPLKVIQVNR